ncbi:MAG: CrcB family protein [Pseudomonadota bacterium]
MIWTLTQVALGGALGSVLRYLAISWIGAPVATLAVNVLGSFAMGVVFVALSNRAHLSPLFMAGILGGFTTFSAFSLDAWKLWQAGQSGGALVYIAASVGLSILALALGAALAERVLV